MVLAILPWLVAAGIPRLRALDAESAEQPVRDRAVRDRTAPDQRWTALALALPCAALGLRLDVASGFELRERLVVAAVSLVLAILLAVAARRAARSPATHARHAIAWLVLVPGLPLLIVVLREAGLPLLGEPIGALGAIASASPLAWLWRQIAERGDALGLAASQLARVGGPALVCVGLWLCSAGAGERLEAR
jgi:hypothetical protein